LKVDGFLSFYCQCIVLGSYRTSRFRCKLWDI